MVDILQGLTETQVGALRMRQVRAGEVIFSEGEPAYGLFSIMDGKIEICRGAGTDKERQLAVMGRGDIFGEMALIIDSRERTATARALETSTLFEIPGNPLDFAASMPTPKVAIKLLQNLVCLLGERLRGANRHEYVERRGGGSEPRPLSGREADFRGPLAVIEHSLPKEAWLRKKANAGEHLCLQGDDADGFYFIHEGELAVETREDGDARVVARLQPPILVGEVGCFAGEKRLATVRATTDIEYTYFPRDYFEQLAESYPTQAAEVLMAVARVVTFYIVKPDQGG